MDARLWLVFFLCASAAAPPGIQAGLSQATINDLKNDMLPQVIKQLSTVQLSDFYKQVGSGFLAATVVVSKIRCTDLYMDVTNSNLAMFAPDSLVLTALGMKGQMSFSWSYESPLGGDSGEGTIQLQPTSITATFKVSQQDGKPVVTVSSLKFQISGLDMTISNSPIASVANWLFSVFKDNILTGLTEVLDQYGTEIMNSMLSDFLGKYQTQMPLTDTIAIDYSLVANPVISDSYAQVGILGSFIDLTHPQEVMVVDPPVPLPQFDPEGKKVQVYISEYTLNTGLYAGMTSGAFQGQITPQTPTIGTYMTTSWLMIAFPGLNTVYGDGKPCSMNCEAVQPAPKFTAGDDALTGLFTLSCDLLVETTKALSVDVSATFETEIALQDWVLHLNLTNANVTDVSTYDSKLPDPANDEALKDLMNTILATVAPKIFSSVFGNGMPLPTLEDVDLSSATFSIEDGYLAVGVSPVYHYVVVPPS